MSPEDISHNIVSEDKLKVSSLLKEFCTEKDNALRTSIISALKKQLNAFSDANCTHRQSIGLWVLNFIKEIIPYLENIKTKQKKGQDNLISFIMNLPYDDNSDMYKSVLESVPKHAVFPLEPQRYLFLLQICALMSELDYDKSDVYQEELNKIINRKKAPNQYSLFAMMMTTRAYAISGKQLEEQLIWLDVILLSWMYLKEIHIIYFLSQWIISLKWIRPNLLRKELFLSLYEFSLMSDIQNQAIILYELFNLPDKATATGEKLTYLHSLQAMPKELLTVNQLQDIYYFSGSIKSSMHTNFMESVSDFQQSNYYIYRYWSWIRNVNQLFRNQFSSEDYLDILSRIEQKTVELINLINIQSNAYVETLQSNFDKIEELYHQVEELSLRDTLTGLYNRRFLYNNINELLLLAARQQSPLSFVVIDIDDFKPINDTYGHLAGDYILTELSAMFKSYFRKSDFIIRYGGEEFLIVMFNSNHLQTEQIMETLRNNILNNRYIFQNYDLHITVSIGIASCIFESTIASIDLERLISDADAAMYKSKTNGKNRITSTVVYL